MDIEDDVYDAEHRFNVGDEFHYTTNKSLREGEKNPIQIITITKRTYCYIWWKGVWYGDGYYTPLKEENEGKCKIGMLEGIDCEYIICEKIKLTKGMLTANLFKPQKECDAGSI